MSAPVALRVAVRRLVRAVAQPTTTVEVERRDLEVLLALYAHRGGVTGPMRVVPPPVSLPRLHPWQR